MIKHLRSPSRFKDTLIPEMGEHFAPLDILHEQIEMFIVLSDSFEVDHERMANFTQNMALINDVISLLGFNDLRFFHDLRTGELLRFLMFCELNLPKRTYIHHGIPTPSKVSSK